MGTKKLRALLKAKRRENNVKIPTKLGIVYATRHRGYEVLPYLDVSRKSSVCGISIKDSSNQKEVLWVSTEDFGKEFHYFGYNWGLHLILGASKKEMDIPGYTDMLKIYFNVKEINEVIDVLIKYGVKAEKLIGPYIMLGSGPYVVDDMLVYHLHGDKAATYEKFHQAVPYKTRLVKHW